MKIENSTGAETGCGGAPGAAGCWGLETSLFSQVLIQTDV